MRIARRQIRFCAVMLVMLGAASAAFAQGKLQIVGGDTHDWGTVDPGKLTARVELKNVGSGNVNILEVRPTCLCTIAPVDTNFLAPGASAHVSITLDAMQKTGVIERSILVRWTDSAAKGGLKIDSSWIHLKANIYREIYVSPVASIIVGSSRPGEEARALPLKIQNVSPDTIVVQPPVLQEGANHTFRFEMPGPRKLAPGEMFELKTYVTPFKPGALAGTVVMKTSSKKMPEIVMNVAGTVAVGSSPSGAAATSTEAPASAKGH